MTEELGWGRDQGRRRREGGEKKQNLQPRVEEHKIALKTNERPKIVHASFQTT